MKCFKNESYQKNHFYKYETIVSRNGLSLGYSELDTSSVSSVLGGQYSGTVCSTTVEKSCKL